MSNGCLVDIKVEGKLDGVLKKIADTTSSVWVGFLDGATYPNGTSVAYVAYLNEFGQHNPPRPFLKRTVEKRFNAWTKLIETTLKSEGITKEGVRTALNRVGITAVGDVKKTIKAWSPGDPRYNKPATIARKARRARGGKNLVPINPETALIDSGVMIMSVKYKVMEK